ncbi:MAG: hypothetical protein KJ077_32620 [Anaerolineae bacterium]|nr:hypothetical protein [Anaerolineae bacterium]
MAALAYWIIDTAGVGSFIALLIPGVAFIAYILTVRWVQAAPPERPVLSDPSVVPAGGETP